MKKLVIIFVFLFLLCAFSVSAFAQSSMDVTLGWNHNNPEQVQYFVVCYGTTSGTYSNEVDAGDVFEYKVSGLSYGTMHYFAVKAFGWNGLESGYSNEVATDGETIPASPTSAPGCFILSIEVH